MRLPAKINDTINSPYVFIAPAVAMFGVFILYPVLFAFVTSLHQWTGVGPLGDFVGVRNYIEVIFRDPVFHQSFFNTIKMAVGATILQISVAVLLALLIVGLGRTRTLFRTIFFMPCVMSLIAVGLLWNWIYHPMFGIVTGILESLGLDQLVTIWLGDTRTALPSVLVAYSWQSIGIFMVIILAGIQNIPASFYEVASIEGASWRQTLTLVTLPCLRNQLFICMMLCMVFSLKLFPLIYVMTMGGPAYSTELLGLTIYRYAFRFYSTDKASAMSFLLIIVVVLVSAGYTRILKKGDSELE